MAADSFLAFFLVSAVESSSVRPVGCVRQGDRIIFVREPHNPWDSNCVAVFSRGGTMLGHIAKEAAEWLSPMLLGPFRITG